MRLKLDTCENQFIVHGWTELVSGPRPIYAMKCNFLVRVLLLSHVLLISSQLPTVDPAQNPARPLRQWWGGQLAIVRLEVVCAARVVVSNDVSEVEQRASSSELLVDRSDCLSLGRSPVLCRSGTCRPSTSRWRTVVVTGCKRLVYVNARGVQWGRHRRGSFVFGEKSFEWPFSYRLRTLLRKETAESYCFVDCSLVFGKRILCITKQCLCVFSLHTLNTVVDKRWVIITEH